MVYTVDCSSKYLQTKSEYVKTLERVYETVKKIPKQVKFKNKVHVDLSKCGIIEI